MVESSRGVKETARLHRRVGLFIAASSLVVLAVNISSIPQYAEDWGILQLLLAPQILLVALTTVVAGVSAFIPRLRVVDVVILGVNALVATLDADGAEATGFAFLLLGLALASEYGYFTRRTALKIAVTALVFLGVLTLSVFVNDTVTALRAVQTVAIGLVLLGGGWALVTFRSRQIRERQKELEDTVETRTSELSEALESQKLLLSEIHHRTKNNLQLVSSLLSLESDMTAQDPRYWIDQGQYRIQALARAHDLLYASTDTSSTDLSMFVREYVSLIAEVADTHGLTLNASVTVTASTPLDWAIRLAILVNEIVLNAIQHATAADGSTVLTLAMRQHDGHLTIEAADNGPGSTGIGGNNGSGVGLIKSIATSLGGSAAARTDGGVKWDVLVPLPSSR
jgi:two-component sensor histidine kinase